MVTSAYIDFIVDPGIFKTHNRSRNRRLFFVKSLVLGNFVGVIAYKFVSPALALYLSAIGKAIVCVALFFNPDAESWAIKLLTRYCPAAASRVPHVKSIFANPDPAQSLDKPNSNDWAIFFGGHHRSSSQRPNQRSGPQLQTQQQPRPSGIRRN